MGKIQHTPAPWRVNPGTPTVVITPRGRIAVGWNSNDPDDPIHAEAEANARLIAAAPTMLAELRRLEWSAEGAFDDRSACPSCGGLDPAADRFHPEADPGGHAPACTLDAAIKLASGGG